MPENRIGIVIDTRTTGNENMREHIQSLGQLNAGWGHFNDLRREAEQEQPENLKKQNQYIREQIGLLSRLGTMTHREKMEDLQYQLQKQTGKFGKSRIREEIHTARLEHIRDTLIAVQGEAYRKEWAEGKGIGEPSGRDLLTDLTGMGIRGIGPSGMAQMGLGKLARGITGRMAGLGTLAKLGVGTGVGALAFGAYKLVTGALEGKEAYKQIAPDLMRIQAMTGRLGGDARAFREEFEAVALVTGTTLKEMSALEQSYIRIIGAAGDRSAMSGIVNIAQSFGIEKALGVEFTARMGMAGYRPEALSEQRLKEAIIAGVSSGIGEGRLPEFLQGIMSLTDAVMRTSVTADPTLMGRYAGRLGVLGVPFQGQRGVQQLTGFNQAITQGGMGFQAARMVLDKRLGAGNYSIGQVYAQQEQGMNDPENLEMLFALAGKIGGKNPWNQAMLLSKWVKESGGYIPMKALYNPASISGNEDIDSLLEFQRAMGGRMRIGDMTKEDFATATKDIKMDEATRQLMAEFDSDPDAFSKRIKEMMGTTGFEINLRAIATEIGKIETAAYTFERANELFLKGALAIAEVGLGSENARAIVEGLKDLLGGGGQMDEASMRRLEEQQNIVRGVGTKMGSMHQ